MGRAWFMMRATVGPTDYFGDNSTLSRQFKCQSFKAYLFSFLEPNLKKQRLLAKWVV